MIRKNKFCNIGNQTQNDTSDINLVANKRTEFKFDKH